jgi:hydrogenase nickel incorporation protein HypA/HybF
LAPIYKSGFNHLTTGCRFEDTAVSRVIYFSCNRVRHYHMHEMGIALQIVEIATASIPPHLAGGRVRAVNLKLGKLSAVVADSLQFCFEAAARDTVLESACLHITEVPIRARCSACCREWIIETPDFICPACRGGDIELLSGRELDIESIELLEEEP